MKHETKGISEEVHGQGCDRGNQGREHFGRTGEGNQDHFNQISNLKRRVLTNASKFMTAGKKPGVGTEEKLIAQIYKEMSRLKMDIRWRENMRSTCRFESVGDMFVTLRLYGRGLVVGTY